MEADRSLPLDVAAAAARTGDVWLFRGRSGSDRTIRLMTNAPVNHVGMAVVIDDLPPMMWHAELGQALPDLWAGTTHRGAQLHDLTAAVERWCTVYRQQAWLRQLEPPAGRAQEDAVLRVVARWDGTPFPTTAALAGRWLRGRLGVLGARARAALGGRPAHRARHARPEQAFCAEVVAVTYEAMGLLPADRPSSWYDPGRFWSGDELPLAPGWSLGAEIPVGIGPRR